MMVKIKLTQGIYTLIDDEDYPLVSQYKWYVTRCNRRWVAITGPDKKTKGKQLLMTRLVMKARSGQQVDHKKHYEDYIDNRKSNLRLCTHAENGRNRRKQLKKTSSQYKGVIWNKHAGKWQVTIIVSRNYIHLGLFTDEIEAARAYNIAAVEHFGEFAKLNEVMCG